MVPKYSLKSGVDYGSVVRAGLGQLTYVEMMMISPIRFFSSILKLAEGKGSQDLIQSFQSCLSGTMILGHECSQCKYVKGI